MAAPFADVNLADKSLEVEDRGGGEYILRNPTPLNDYPKQLGFYLRKHAEERPDAVWLAERNPDGGWREVTYAEARRAADGISQWLLDQGHGGDNPVACLSDNSINFALLMMGAMQVGIPFLPVSPAYSLMSNDYAKVKYVGETFTPSLVFAEQLPMYAKALKSLDLSGVQVVANEASGEVEGVVEFSDLTKTKPTAEVDQAVEKVDEDTPAKILLTSGSTGMPKGVVNTQRMLCASGVGVDQMWLFLKEHTPVLCDWLPWNHTFGANWCFNLVLRHGGTFHIDNGKPAPGRFENTLKNLREIQPTVFFNVARAYDMLIPELEADDAFAKHFFEKLHVIFYAGAGLPQNLFDRLLKLSEKARGERVPVISALGSTETSPPATVCHWPTEQSGNLGLPIPGCEARLVPKDEKLEIRFKGPNITPGYYRQPEKTEEAFDEEGWYMIGDAVKWADPNDAKAGLLYDGRVAENFKLLTGTWVAVGNLRLNVLSYTQPIIQDAVVTGENQEEVGLLVFPNFAGCKQLIGDGAEDLSPDEIVRHHKVHEALAEKLRAYNKDNPGSSTKVDRVLLMTDPPDIDAGEITDKGYINQNAVKRHRKDLVERLYDETHVGDDTLVLAHW